LPWHQTFKNRILLRNNYLPVDPQNKIGDFVTSDNHLLNKESLINFTTTYAPSRWSLAIFIERESVDQEIFKRDLCNAKKRRHISAK